MIKQAPDPFYDSMRSNWENKPLRREAIHEMLTEAGFALVNETRYERGHVVAFISRHIEGKLVSTLELVNGKSMQVFDKIRTNYFTIHFHKEKQ